MEIMEHIQFRNLTLSVRRFDTEQAVTTYIMAVVAWDCMSLVGKPGCLVFRDPRDTDYEISRL
jgi:hypothetical protein